MNWIPALALAIAIAIALGTLTQVHAQSASDWLMTVGVLPPVTGCAIGKPFG